MEILSVLEQLKDDMVRFFEREGGWFEVYGDAAIKVATIVRSTASIVNFQDVSLLRLVSTAQLAVALKELLQSEKVEIWSFNSARRNWRITCRASPGNVEQLESFLGEEFSSLATPVIAAIASGGGSKIGLVTVDVTRMLFSWASFIDNELFCNLEAALVQVDARECLYPVGMREQLEDSLQMDGCMVKTALPLGEFSSGSVMDDLKQLLVNQGITMVAAEELPDEVQMSISALIRYLGLLAVDENLGVFRLERLNLNRFLRLDECALRSLGVFPTGPASNNDLSTTLYGLLNSCKTRQGSRLLSQWIRQPLRDILELTLRQDIVEALVEASVERQELREVILRGIPDISRVTRKLIKGRATLQDLVLIYTAISKITPIYECFTVIRDRAPEAIAGEILDPLQRIFAHLGKFVELIEGTVDFEALARHEYLIRADFQATLSSLSSRREALLDEMEKEFDRVAALVGLEKGKKIKLERNPTYGYFLRLSRLDAGTISGVEGVHELAALKNGIYFVTSHLRDLSLLYDELGKEYSKEQSALVVEMLKVGKTYRRPFEELNDLLARIDVFQSLAYVAVTAPIPYVRPRLLPPDESGIIIELKGMRHPCLELVTTFIPNDVAFTAESSFQIITGPNMGGKSTFIRSAALNVLMAQIGSFIPSATATISLCDAILVRVGAGDSILKGISTFMAEMLETAAILRTATSHSLIIIDELGRGTSTSEGFGLAWAVAKRLASLGAPSFFATHFHELTTLAAVTSRVNNLHTEATIVDDGELMMTFKVKGGGCDQSYGIQCAQMAGFPPLVIDMARIILNDLEAGGTNFTGEEAHQGLSFLRSLEAEGAGGSFANAPPFIKKLLSQIH